MRIISTILLIYCQFCPAEAQILDPVTSADFVRLIQSSDPNKKQACNNPSGVAQDVCEDISALSCKTGVIQDGTGFSWRGSEGELEAKDRAELEGHAHEYFKANLGKSKKLFQLMEKKCGVGLPENAMLECSIKHGVDMAVYEKPDKDTKKKTPLVKRVQDNIQKNKTDRILGPFYLYLQDKMMKPGLEQEIEKSMVLVKESLVSVIQKSSLSKNEKKRLSRKINSIVFEGVRCDPESIEGKNRMDAVLMPNAYYKRDTNSFRYCNGMERNNNSLFARYQMIAHELSHSIDPLSFELQGSSTPFKDLVQCLRSEESVKARAGEHDQINEAFSDFMGAEVMSDLVSKINLTREQYQNGVANSMRSAYPCISEQDPENPHASLSDRLNRVVMANPTIRRLTGCEKINKVKYCGWAK